MRDHGSVRTSRWLKIRPFALEPESLRLTGAESDLWMSCFCGTRPREAEITAVTESGPNNEPRTWSLLDQNMVLSKVELPLKKTCYHPASGINSHLANFFGLKYRTRPGQAAQRR